MLSERYLHPNGQIPAYEWSFSDVNPPVHAWATIFTYRLEQVKEGMRDIKWLKKCFQKLLLNFTWWVNRKDRSGRNVFEGGFLGLDNIGVFDRSAPLPTGGYLEQADGTAWMALFADNCTPSLIPACSVATPTGVGPSGCQSTCSSSALWSTTTRIMVTLLPSSAQPARASA